ncbi:hypothetical protein [Caproicibacter fermentans]|uniref:Uncharacterized protein n=1 Tax=Caproicibacter fermentans TaxID=2576756 RepID=A0A7G8TF52_9FIRM|nr:hypothetical protein [Caproicibacter fermentans]QNK42243.1 hypothetical protein HCR03_08560 [Caproicibacter fermentans]
MSNPAIYIIRENGENHFFSVFYGANALSPLLRLSQAKAVQEALPEHPPISQVYEHLDYAGNYRNPRLDDADMFCKRIPPDEMPQYNKDYAEHGNFQMRMIFDLDQNSFMMEYNPNCPWYRTMGSFSIDLDVGLENVRKLLEYAEKKGISDFDALLNVYQRSTGLEDKLEYARGYMRFEEYLDSPQAEEDRRRYRKLLDRQTQPDEEEKEER